MNTKDTISPLAIKYREFISLYPGLRCFMEFVRDRSGTIVAAEVWIRIDRDFLQDLDRPLPGAFEAMPSFWSIRHRPASPLDHVDHWMQQLKKLIALKP